MLKKSNRQKQNCSYLFVSLSLFLIHSSLSFSRFAVSLPFSLFDTHIWSLPKILIRVIQILLHGDAANDFQARWCWKLWTFRIGFDFWDCGGGEIFFVHSKPTIPITGTRCGSARTRGGSARLWNFIGGYFGFWVFSDNDFWLSSWLKYSRGFWPGIAKGALAIKMVPTMFFLLRERERGLRALCTIHEGMGDIVCLVENIVKYTKCYKWWGCKIPSYLNFLIWL